MSDAPGDSGMEHLRPESQGTPDQQAMKQPAPQLQHILTLSGRKVGEVVKSSAAAQQNPGEYPQIFSREGVRKVFDDVRELTRLLKEKHGIEWRPTEGQASTTQCHTFQSAEKNYYILGETHTDPQSLLELEEIFNVLDGQSYEDTIVFLEDMRGQSLDEVLETVRTSPTRLSGCLPDSITVATTLAERLHVTPEVSICSLGHAAVIERAATLHKTPASDFYAVLMYDEMCNALHMLPKDLRTDDSWDQIIDIYLASYAARFHQQESDLSRTLQQFKISPSLRSTLIEKLKTTARIVTKGKMQEALTKKPDAKNIVCVSGSGHLEEVFEGLGLQSEMSRIKKQEIVSSISPRVRTAVVHWVQSYLNITIAADDPVIEILASKHGEGLEMVHAKAQRKIKPGKLQNLVRILKGEIDNAR